MQSGPYAARLFRSAALGALIAAASPALAQVADQTASQPVETTQPPEAAEDDGDRVIITGSRIPRDAFTSTAPIQVITAEASTLEGLVDTAEILQGSSIAQGSTQFNNSFGNFVIEGGPGINSVSLRGLGAQRSLVLLNNHRPGPAGVRGQVGAFDLNVLPDSIISRVEILKDGASSIYGSDAVAGVVNIITRTSVDAPELTVQYNATEQGGGNTLQASGAIGFDLFGGQLMLAAEYEDRDPLKLSDRKNLACAQDLAYDATTGQRIDRIDRSILAGSALAGCDNLYHNTVVDAVSGLRYVPSPNGVTVGPIAGYRPRNNRTFLNSPDGTAYYEDVLNSPKFGEGYAISGVERLSLYGKADFTILDGIEWTTEVLINRREFEHKAWRQFFPQIASANGYDVPGPYTAGPGFALHPAGFRLTQPVTIWPADQGATVDYYYVRTGLEGDFFMPGWTWSLNASTSLSDGEYTSQQIQNETAGDWNFVSPSDGLYHGPTYNPFDPAFLSGNWSDATFDLLNAVSVGTTTYEQTTVQGVVAGDLLELPAGPLGLAVGAEWRTFEIDDRPSGLGWMSDGSMLIVSMTQRRVLRRAADGTLAIHADLSGIAAFHCNDMVVDSRGGAYVGEFGFDLDAAIAARGVESVLADHPAAKLAYVAPDGTVSVATGDMHFPNGAVITPDGRTLIVGETLGAVLTAFDIGADGALSNRRVWASTAPHVPDGICLDAEGAVWIANPIAPQCVRIAAGGAVLEVIDTGQPCFACMLGGDDGKTLFMLTAATSDHVAAAASRTGRIVVAQVDAGRAGLP